MEMQISEILPLQSCYRHLPEIKLQILNRFQVLSDVNTFSYIHSFIT